ncbi:MAG: bifunctional 5,10-methylenetetrahydrofolate dehydrogenase/5,10-methenyltetrahydrofolate cyclohydrolase [Clostridiales bacterium]|jgi:methylenetetrahydrofolate dehydrogenase (NADP+)/methenyltetrahydrofolate cyclohydrolase|nr:bifunctional 5,10-methylenetetrahydrofolate dehydrogenase/5,10-methenyltetrahydrofolate cyclohydrolase [Clostridiales bacterium]
MAQIIDGKALSAVIRERVKARVAKLERPPALAVVLAGNDAPSLVYVRNKEKACAEAGIRFVFHQLEENVSQKEMLALIDKLNADGDIDGVLIQQPNPLPPNLDMHEAVCRVDPLKDVDCLHPYNAGLVMAGTAAFLPATPAGVVAMLKESNIEMKGKRCVILGRSNVVGKPLAMLMLQQNATVTVCHSHTRDLREITRQADILIAAVRQPLFVKADMIKENAVVIDVGINRLEGKKICGDADYKDCFEKASYITRVPGGVGPMTVAMLLENCVKAYELRRGVRV